MDPRLIFKLILIFFLRVVILCPRKVSIFIVIIRYFQERRRCLLLCLVLVLGSWPADKVMYLIAFRNTVTYLKIFKARDHHDIGDVEALVLIKPGQVVPSQSLMFYDSAFDLNRLRLGLRFFSGNLVGYVCHTVSLVLKISLGRLLRFLAFII